jgi:site-specific recombinase XerD
MECGACRRKYQLRRYRMASMEELREYPIFVPHSEFGDPKPITPKVRWEACREAAEPAGITKAVHPHLLRHYAAFRTMPHVDVNEPVHSLQSRGCAAYSSPLPGTLGG